MNFPMLRDRTNAIFFLIFIMALLIYPAMQRKIQVHLWHLWNGNTTRLEKFEIPVPRDWVANHTVLGTVTLIEAEASPTGGEFRSMIFISKNGSPKDISIVSSLHDQSLRSQGAQVFDRKTIEFDGEKADCIVSNALIHRLNVPSGAIISIECESTAGLSMNFNGDEENIDTFWSVLSQIRERGDKESR